MAAARAVLKGGDTVGAERSERSGLNRTVWNRVQVLFLFTKIAVNVVSTNSFGSLIAL